MKTNRILTSPAGDIRRKQYQCLYNLFETGSYTYCSTHAAAVVGPRRFLRNLRIHWYDFSRTSHRRTYLRAVRPDTRTGEGRAVQNKNYSSSFLLIYRRRTSSVVRCTIARCLNAPSFVVKKRFACPTDGAESRRVDNYSNVVREVNGIRAEYPTAIR